MCRIPCNTPTISSSSPPALSRPSSSPHRSALHMIKFLLFCYVQRTTRDFHYSKLDGLHTVIDMFCQKNIFLKMVWICFDFFSANMSKKYVVSKISVWVSRTQNFMLILGDMGSKNVPNKSHKEKTLKRSAKSKKLKICIVFKYIFFQKILEIPF